MASQHATYADREDTAVEEAVKREWSTANKLMEVLASAEHVESHVPELAGAIFCGHLVADLDSVAGAIGVHTNPSIAQTTPFPNATMLLLHCSNAPPPRPPPLHPLTPPPIPALRCQVPPPSTSITQRL